MAADFVLLGDGRQFQRLVAQVGGVGVGVRGDLADDHPAQAVGEQLLEAGHVPVRASQDQAAGAAGAVELLGDLGRILLVLARLLQLVALDARVGPAAAAMELHFFAQIALGGLQNAQVEGVQAGAFLVHMDHAAAFVGVQDVRELAYIGPEGDKSKVLDRHIETEGPPEILLDAAEEDHAAPLAVVAHLDVIVDALHIFRIGILHLVQQLAQGQLVLLARAPLGVKVEIDAQDRRVVALKFNCALDITSVNMSMPPPLTIE